MEKKKTLQRNTIFFTLSFGEKKGHFQTGNCPLFRRSQPPALNALLRRRSLKLHYICGYLGFEQASRSRRSHVAALPSNSMRTKQKLFYLICAAWPIGSPHGAFAETIRGFFCLVFSFFLHIDVFFFGIHSFKT